MATASITNDKSGDAAHCIHNTCYEQWWATAIINTNINAKARR